MAEISSMVVVEVATTKLATPICSVRFSINMDMKLISITTDMMMIMFPLNLWITPNKSQSQSSPNPNQLVDSYNHSRAYRGVGAYLLDILATFTPDTNHVSKTHPWTIR
ncbi:hypothetical protein JHK87_043069 [Glycine soja]|nr:hypothetical protein JHK87_043069 [Glycine soja]